MTAVERGQRLRLTLTGEGLLGEALSEVNGKPVFVFGGIAGEEVEVEVIRERRRYIAAEVMEVVSASPHRKEAPCQYFGQCTGCQWQHIEYEQQLEMKRGMVEDALRRVGRFTGLEVLPTLASPQQLGYRNHARFTINPEGNVGYIHRERRHFVEIDKCLLMGEGVNDTLRELQGRCAETTQVAVRYSAKSGSRLLQPTLKNSDIPLESGQKHYTEAVNGVSFQVAASSFFQVNVQQLEQMAALVRESLQLSGHELVVDAYAGVGTFAALLSPYAGRVIAIEESASAIQDATKNLAGFQNVEILVGKTEAVMLDMEEAVDALVVDPPRAGCQVQALESIIRLAPSRIAYVSCDPATLARDLRILTSGPYKIETVQPIDMFPQTYHVECIATLSLKAGHPITLASTSTRRTQILRDGGIPYSATAPDTDESLAAGDPEALVQELAMAKARKVAAKRSRGLVLAADTLVVDGDTVLGKPQGEAEALEMLVKLGGREHRVLTGVAVVNASTGDAVTDVESSGVAMRDYTKDEAQEFVASGKALDKAGAYAVQDTDFRPAALVDGCYVNVVGLPLCLSVKLLRQMGAKVGTPPVPEGCNSCRLDGGRE